ncbi:transmembrane emp24 domain-containing protein 6-like [Oppia nitens]|uniref:transmembrane emp24 domain-containing protein 6-like n=1 Tax=Oppia nitens TaxID=1686743 RepID=UPI0023DC310F|nr:transmembrane emp24 domain-containing protein 6-like [Oppia nitens]
MSVVMAMYCWQRVVPYVVAVSLLVCTCLTRALAESYSSTNFEDKLGIAYEFKIHIDAGKEDCFYQYIQQSSSLYVAFQVMRGGDNQAGFAIRDPIGQLIMPYQWKPHAEYDEASVQTPGYYSLCIDNTVSRFASKLVSLYVASFKRDEWEKYIQELTDAEVTVGNFTNALRTVDNNIGLMIKSLDHSRRLNTADWYLVDGNNRYVRNWSIAQCIVVVISSVVQVVFVKKLFDSKDPLKGKPRA